MHSYFVAADRHSPSWLFNDALSIEASVGTASRRSIFLKWSSVILKLTWTRNSIEGKQFIKQLFLITWLSYVLSINTMNFGYACILSEWKGMYKKGKVTEGERRVQIFLLSKHLFVARAICRSRPDFCYEKCLQGRWLGPLILKRRQHK